MPVHIQQHYCSASAKFTCERNPCLSQTSLLKHCFVANSSPHHLLLELPEAVGYCDEENLYLAIPTFGLHQYWNLYLGNKLLTRHVAHTNGYLAATNSTHLVLQVPLFAVGVIYEVHELYSNASFKANRTVCSYSHSPAVTVCSAIVLHILENLQREGLQISASRTRGIRHRPFW